MCIHKMDTNDGISEIYQILSNLLLTDLNDMLILTREQCIDENKKVYEDLLKSLMTSNTHSGNFAVSPDEGVVPPAWPARAGEAGVRRAMVSPVTPASAIRRRVT